MSPLMFNTALLTLLRRRRRPSNNNENKGELLQGPLMRYQLTERSPPEPAVLTRQWGLHGLAINANGG